MLSTWIKESNYTVVLTGAGMSTESGIPDFRSKDGWWKEIDPRTVATIDALENNYSLFHEFYSTRINNLQQVKPHQGHEILAKWEKEGIIHCVATQNVDSFHQLAGNQKVYELHGSIRSSRCHHCDVNAKLSDFIEGNPCAVCGGRFRPNVVLFGEMLPERAWNEALESIKKAELVIVIGTSLQVYPVNQLPSMTKGRVAIINNEPTELDSKFDFVIHGKAGEVLKQIDDHF